MGEPHPMIEDMSKRNAKASRSALDNAARIKDVQRSTADYMVYRARQQADEQDRREGRM